MLIRFNVKNFLSFYSDENGKSKEFSMIAGKSRSKRNHMYDDGKVKLLKLATVYGANAAGKSNLVKAMDFMRSVVIGENNNGYSQMYCKVDPNNAEKPSYFEVEVKLGEKYYSYGFEIILDEWKFISEWLIELKPDGNDKVLFTRDILNKEFEFGTEFKKNDLIKSLDIYSKELSEDDSILFLTVMNRNKKYLYQTYENAYIFKNMYDWFVERLDVIYPDQPISYYDYLAVTGKVEEVCALISGFGTGITGMEIVEVPLDQVLVRLPKSIRAGLIAKLEAIQVKLKKESKNESLALVMRSSQDFFIVEVFKDTVICKTIEFSHGKNNALFKLSEESDGTIRLLDLIEILLSDGEKTYVVDELDRCLHPSMSYKFIELFLQIAQKKNIQLIVTTHESRLMDFDLLRRDEIWLINKDKNGISDIYSLEEYCIRFDLKIDKAYLEGRFGAVPKFSTISR